ncbi:MAG: DegT/DnrJ/EryC1/StrS family aminotransferase [Kiritimatiellae bacterium]|nr:DegT/DnrJ/EryC1/StrS family aminotransferase [Kiritimatiellia bacterium]
MTNKRKTIPTTRCCKPLALAGGLPVRSTPFPKWPVFDGKDRRMVLKALDSGRWGKLDGAFNKEFEEKFAAYVDCRFGVTTVNGSVTLKLALWAGGVREGDEVIVPPYTFIATATAVLECNATPVFVDIHPDTYNLDPAMIEQAITPRTKAIIPVHMGGLCADMDRINAIARKHNLLVVEDAAHAHGAEWKGRKAGSLGDIASFSFQSSKNLNSGEGGIVTTRNRTLADRCRWLHHCGRLPGREWYEHGILGGNYRLGELQAALLLAQLTRLEKQTRTRDKNGLYLNRELARIEGIAPLKRGGGETRHCYHLYLCRYRREAFGGWPREKFVKAMQAEGIPFSAGYLVPIYRQPYFLDKDFGPFHKPSLDYRKVRCPACEKACAEEALWLTQNVMLGSRADMDDIVEAVRKVQCAARG